MTIRRASVSAAAGVALLLTFNVEAAHYEIDSSETKTTYETRYLGFIPVRGVFERMTGTLHYEPDRPIAERDASIHVIIDATTLRPTNFSTESKRRLLRGPQFFDVEKFPTKEFKSSLFRFDIDKLVAIDGTITLLGVTKPVTLHVLKSACEPAAPPRAARCTASTELTVKRFEFGMNAWSATVGDEVTIAVELVAVAAGVTAGAANAGTTNEQSKAVAVKDGNVVVTAGHPAVFRKMQLVREVTDFQDFVNGGVRHFRCDVECRFECLLRREGDFIRSHIASGVGACSWRIYCMHVQHCSTIEVH